MNHYMLIKKIGIFILLVLVMNNNGMARQEGSIKRPLEQDLEDLQLPASKYEKEENIPFQSSSSVPLTVNSIPQDLRKLIVTALSYADDKAQAKRLQAIIEGTSIQEEYAGQDKQTRLYNAIENIRNILTSNKSFSSILNDQKFTGELISSLSKTYEYPLVDVAIALGTNAAARWIAGKYDDNANIKHSAWERIWTAAAQGDVSVLRFLLTYASDVSRNYLVNTTFSKTPPLTMAVQKNRPEAVRYLLTQKGIDLEKIDIHSNTPLMHAASLGYEEIFDELVRAGADINKKNINSTVLELAVKKNKLAIVNWLIKLKADLNHQNEDGKTALISAVINNYEPIAQALIAAGADLNVQDKNGDTALIHAAFLNNEVIVKKLIEKKADLNVQDNLGNTALILVASKNHEAIGTDLIAAGADLNVQDKNGKTALIWAVENNHEAIANRLIAAGADLDKQSAQEYSALEWAIMNNNSNLVEKLVKVGSKSDRRKITALEIAAFHGKNQIIQFLFDLNRFNNRELEINAAIFHALKTGNLDTVKLLLEHLDKVDNSMKWEGHSVLWYARTSDHSDKDEIIKLLIEKGAKE